MLSIFKRKIKKPAKRALTNLKISVIMPVFLGGYEGCAENREEKFIDAIDSFRQQSYKNKELVIISDGCPTVLGIVSGLKNKKDIVFKQIKKQALFSGTVRHEGIKLATGDVICYLDSDDLLGKHHLSTIISAFESDTSLDWVFYNDLILPPHRTPVSRSVALEKGLAGTSCIAHRSLCNVTWKGCDKYNHDWLFIEQLIKKHPKNAKIFGAEYYVCHIPNIF